MGKTRIRAGIGLFAAFSPLGILAFFVLVPSGSCGKEGGEEPAIARYGTVERTGFAPTPKLARYVAPPEEVFTNIGCEHRFPSAGMRFVEEREYELIVPRGFVAAYHHAGSHHDQERYSVSIDEASGLMVSRATIAHQFWSVEKGKPPDRSSASTETASAEDVAARPWDRSEATIVGPLSLSAALSKPSVPALEAAVARLIESDPSYGMEKTTVKLSPPRHEEKFDLFDVDATWMATRMGMSQATDEDAQVSGTLVLRAADGALVDLALEGVSHTQSSVYGQGASNWTGPRQDVHGKERISRPCFRTPIEK
jgi:hypothetical protein